MIEINLIPDVKQELLKAQRARTIVISSAIIASIAAVGVVILLLLYIYPVQGLRGQILDGDIDKKGKEFSNTEDLSKVLTIQNQLKSISELNDQKKMNSRIFDTIAAITPLGSSPVEFSRISAGEAFAEEGTTATSNGGQLSLEGQTNGYDSMEVFKKTISNTVLQYTEDGETKTIPLAENISTGDISYGEDADGKKVLRFTVTFNYPAELLSPKVSNIAFKLNVNGNVTDSYLGIPRFTERAKDINGGN